MEKAHTPTFTTLKSINIELPHQVPLDCFLLQKLFKVATTFVFVPTAKTAPVEPLSGLFPGDKKYILCSR